MPLSDARLQRSFPCLAKDFPENVVTQAHLNYCHRNGHATHKWAGVTNIDCPRCGESVWQPNGQPLPTDHPDRSPNA